MPSVGGVAVLDPGGQLADRLDGLGELHPPTDLGDQVLVGPALSPHLPDHEVRAVGV